MNLYCRFFSTPAPFVENWSKGLVTFATRWRMSVVYLHSELFKHLLGQKIEDKCSFFSLWLCLLCHLYARILQGLQQELFFSILVVFLQELRKLSIFRCFFYFTLASVKPYCSKSAFTFTFLNCSKGPSNL